MSRGLFAEAFRGGVEVTLSQLAHEFKIDIHDDVLGAAVRISDQCSLLRLTLVPDVTRGDLGTPRILRDPEVESVADLEEALERGECNDVEFKSTLLLDLNRQEYTGEVMHSLAVTHSVIKTFAAFLNSEGGTLIIGVDDDGVITSGISGDMDLKKWTLDQWNQFLDQEILTRFTDGHAVRQYIRTEVVLYGEQYACVCKVAARAEPCFVRKPGEDAILYYVRNGSRTDSLDLPDFYLRMRERYLISV